MAESKAMVAVKKAVEQLPKGTLQRKNLKLLIRIFGNVTFAEATDAVTYVWENADDNADIQFEVIDGNEQKLVYVIIDIL